MKKYLMILSIIGFNFLLTNNASATITGGQITGGTALSNGGSFVDLGSAPTGLVVGNDTFQNPNLYGFNEDQNIFLTSDLAIDVGTTSIASLTEVASHYVFFDPRYGATVAGWVEFDSEVLGIITSTTNLASSDFLINNDVTYLNPTLRGLESNQDTVWIDGTNNNRINLSFYASTPGDYIRVITARSPSVSVPEISSIYLLVFGLLGLLVARRKI